MTRHPLMIVPPSYFRDQYSPDEEEHRARYEAWSEANEDILHLEELPEAYGYYPEGTMHHA